MTFPFPGLFAIDPEDPANVAANAELTIFDPSDTTHQPIILTDSEGLGIPNPLTTNDKGFVGLFYAELDEVAWAAAGLEGLVQSYQGIKAQALSAANHAAESKDLAQRSEENSSLSAQAAKDAANMVNAPADEVIATLLGADGSETQAAGDGRWARVLKSEAAPAPVKEVFWLKPSTNQLHRAVDFGQAARVNKAVNPRFQSSSGRVDAPTIPAVLAVSFNLRNRQLDAGTSRDWATRLPAVVEAVTSMGAHIVGLQEVDGAGRKDSQAVQLATALGAPWVALDSPQNNSILYRSDKFEPVMEPFNVEINRVYLQSNTQRSMLCGLFRMLDTNQRIIFASTHLSSEGEALALAQAESAQIIGETLLAYRNGLPDRPPVILTGDFNSSSIAAGSPFEVLTRYGLVNSRDKAVSVVNPTLNSLNGFKADMAGYQEGKWIDAVFTSAEVTVPTAGVHVKFANGTSLPLATPIPSDHNPVYASLRLPKVAGARLQAGLGSVSTGGGAAAYLAPNPLRPDQTVLCIDPAASTSVATAAYPAGQSEGMTYLGLEAGKTYTVSATLILDKPQTGTLDANARKIMIGANASFTFAQSQQAPNVPGEHRLSVTFTYTPTVTTGHVRLMNGSRTEKAYWADLVVEEGSTDGTYFDGDREGCYWEGAPGLSRSIYPGPSWVPVGG